MRNIIVLGAILATLPVAVFASEPGGSESCTTLFAKTCMANFYSQDKLREEMAAQESPVLNAEQSKVFLGGATGTAWGVAVDDAAYIVVLRDDNVCAVYAQRVPVAEVQKNFTAMVSAGVPPLVAEKIKDISPAPVSGSMTTIAFSWSRAGDKVKLVFTLTTSSEESPTIQAFATMSLGRIV